MTPIQGIAFFYLEHTIACPAKPICILRCKDQGNVNTY